MKKVYSVAFLGLMILLMYLPILILAVYSFTDSANIGAIHNYSLQNYVTLFTKPELREIITGVSSVFCVCTVDCHYILCVYRVRRGVYIRKSHEFLFKSKYDWHSGL